MKTKIEKRWFLAFATLLLLLGLGIAYARGDIGMSERAMCQENGDAMEPGDSFKSQIGESMAAFLHYNVEEEDYDLDIYVKKNRRIGWFFRYGSSGGAEDALIRYTLDENGEYVLTFLSAGSRGNTPAVSRIEIDKGNGTTVTIAPEENKPFAYVMSRRWNVVVYSEDGSILTPLERKM